MVHIGVNTVVETSVETGAEIVVKIAGEKRSTFLRQGWLREKKGAPEKRELCFCCRGFHTGFRVGFRTDFHIRFRTFFRTTKNQAKWLGCVWESSFLAFLQGPFNSSSFTTTKVITMASERECVECEPHVHELCESGSPNKKGGWELAFYFLEGGGVAIT